MRKIGFALLASLCLVASPALAQSDFFKGKQIKIVVGFTAGASSIYGRGSLPNTWANTFPATRI